MIQQRLEAGTGGIIGMTLTIARDLAERGIRVMAMGSSGCRATSCRP
jgi:NAD(P)-dependent dehydrogenase (short-subunit alcohol dehydrogenase family)